MPLQVAVVGAGWMGGYHASAVTASGDRVAVIVDRDLDRAAALAAEYGATAVRSIDELGSHGIDAVIVTTPTNDHVATTRDLLDQGHAVLVEKPHRSPLQQRWTPNVDDPLCWVGMTTRYHGGMLAIRDAVQSGELGDVLWWSDRIWYNLKPDTLPDWYFDPAVSGGGVLVTNGVHALDRARWILGPLDITSVSTQRFIAEHDVEHSAVVTARAGAAVAEISLMWAPGPIAPSGTVIVGSLGTVVVETGVGWTVTTAAGERSGTEGDELEPFRRQWQAFRSALGGAVIADAPTAAALEPVIDAITRMYEQPQQDHGYGAIT